jgi:ABC-type lipoprotein release transport system permease subunit
MEQKLENLTRKIYDGGVERAKKDAEEITAYAQGVFDELHAAGVRVKLDDRGRIPTPLSPGSDFRILAELRQAIGPEYRLLTWYDLSRAQFDGLVQTRRVLLVIMAMLVLVAVTSVASGLLSMAHEHRDDFAILEVSGRIRVPESVMLVSAGVIGVVGGITGTALGTLLSLSINAIIVGLDWLVTALGFQAGIGRELYLTQIPVQVSAWDLLWPTVLSVGVGMLAAIVPIRKHRTRTLSARLRASRSA